MSIESRSRQYGKVFDHWQIREFLGGGSGGKSAVFRLVHTESSTVFSALKIISLIERRGKLESLSDSRRAEYDRAKKMCKENAEQEVLLMNGLQGQSNVVGYLDHTFIDWEDETGYGYDMLIRMELLKDLRSQLEEEYHFSQDEVLKIGRDICNALVLCHHKEFYHRDIKPENIFYNKDGNYKLGDFGISKIMSATPGAKSSTRAYTEEYAAPEQIFGRYDNRVDIYSLGLVLYELSNNGLLPFASSPYITEIETQERLIGKPIPYPQNASKDFAAVILKACAHNPDDRYQTAEEFLAELNCLAGMGPRPVVKAPSTGRTTQKANNSGDRNATQYAKGDSAPRRSGRETLYADPTSIPHVEREGLTPNKPKRSKAIIVTVALLLVVGIGVAVLLGFNAAADKEAIAGIIDEVNTLCDTQNYDKAIVKIEEGLDEYPRSGELEDKLDEVVGLRTDSNIAAIIADAEKYASDGDYEAAIEVLEIGITSYPESVSIQGKMSEYTETLAAELKAKTLADAKNLAEAGEYESAMSLIKAAQEAYGTSKEYDETYAAYHKAYSLEEAAALAENGDYTGAIKLITDAQKVNANDVEIIAAYNTYCDVYVAGILESADSLLDAWNIADAIKEVEAGLKVIPGNEALKVKLSELESKRPISITTIDSFDSKKWNWNSGTAADPSGNDYSQYSNYVVFTNQENFESFIEYRVGQKYSTLTGIIAPHQDNNAGYSLCVQVYVDDVLVYTSPNVKRKTDAFTFSADVTGAEYIKIVAKRDDMAFGIFGHGDLIVSNVQLWP